MSGGAWSNDQANELIIYDENGNPSIVLSGSADDQIQIRDDNGDTVASIDQEGNASFQSINITDGITLGGADLVDDILTQYPKGIVAYAALPGAGPVTVGTTETAVLELLCELEDQRMYNLSTDILLINGTVLNDQFRAVLHDNGASSPTTGSNTIWLAAAEIFQVGSDRPNLKAELTFGVDDSSPVTLNNWASGTHRVLLGLVRVAGTGTAFYSTGSGSYSPIVLKLMDCGPLVANTGVVPASGGGGSTPVTTYTKTYACTWSGSYLSTGAFTVGGGSTRAYQGDDNAGDGNRKSMLGFPFATIASDLSGATISSIKLTAYFRHWWSGSGGTAVIGTHNSSASSHPTTFSGTTNRVQSSGWPNPGTKTVSLGTTIGNEFKAGTAKGIVLGPGPSTSTTYYGYADGHGATNPPTLTIVYTK